MIGTDCCRSHHELGRIDTAVTLDNDYDQIVGCARNHLGFRLWIEDCLLLLLGPHRNREV